jgi:hypothetical protein
MLLKHPPARCDETRVSPIRKSIGLRQIVMHGRRKRFWFEELVSYKSPHQSVYLVDFRARKELCDDSIG